MDTGNHASYDQWFGMYQQVYREPSLLPNLRCPNCGNQTLHLVFKVAQEGDPQGVAVFWCQTCLFGLPLMRGRVPEGGPIATNEVQIPNYRIVPPPGRTEVNASN